MFVIILFSGSMAASDMIFVYHMDIHFTICISLAIVELYVSTGFGDSYPITLEFRLDGTKINR